jgi:SAM-dependent methyltransferase
VRQLVGDRGAVELADLHELRFEAGAFDAIVCGEVLEHLDDDQTAVREFARVLKPGGVVVASVPANPWRYDWSDHWAGHRRRYTAAGLAERFTAAGFADVDVTDYGFPLLGLYHRQVYRRMLKRRLERDGSDLGAPTGAMRRVAPLLRAAFELDTLFMGRRPGYFGLLASARRPA